VLTSCASSSVAFTQKSFHQYPYNTSNCGVWEATGKVIWAKENDTLGKKRRSSGEKEKASRKKRREKYMVIYAKVQMTGNWPQTPDCVIISPSTTACSSARGKDGERLERKENKKINKMSEDLPNTNNKPQTSVFSFGSCSECKAINSSPLVFFFLKGTIAWLSLLSYCLSGSRRGQAEEVVSRRRRDNLMDVCWYLDH